MNTSADRDLTAAETGKRANRYGRNELAEEPPASIWRRVFNRMNQFVGWIHIATADISALIGDWRVLYWLGEIVASALIQLLIAAASIWQKTFGLVPEVVRLWPVILIDALILESVIECGTLLYALRAPARELTNPLHANSYYTRALAQNSRLMIRCAGD